MTRGVGPKEGPEGQDAKKSKKAVDAESFKEMMRVGKVREVDPEEQRKGKKNRQEIEAEAAAQGGLGAPTPQLTPGAVPESDETFKIDVSNLAEPTSSSAASSPDEYSEEEIESTPTYTEQTPAPAPAAAAPSAPPLPPEGDIPQMEDESAIQQQGQQQQPQPIAQAPEENKKAKKAKKKEAPGEVIKVPKVKKTKLEAPVKKVAKPPENLKTKKETAFPEKREVFPEKLAAAPPKKEEAEEVGKEMEVPMAPLPPGSWERVKEESEEKKVVEISPVTASMPVDIVPTGYEIPAPVTTQQAPFARFPQMWDLFDRMVGVMTVMTDSGISETTINLTSDQFKASPFFGTQIVVREFSTAPKVFNIEMLVPAQVTSQVQANYNELVAAFQAGKYNFKVNRLEWRELPAKKEEKKGKVSKIKKHKEEE